MAQLIHSSSLNLSFMKTYFTLLFSIVILPLFGQIEPYQLFQIEETIDGKHYARSFGELDTFIVQNEVTVPNYRKDTVYHPKRIELIKSKRDTVYYKSNQCENNTITTIDYYTVFSGKYHLKQRFVTKQVVLFPATTRTLLFAYENTYKRRIEVVKAIYGTKSEAVFTQCIAPRLRPKRDTTQVKVPNDDCKQYYKITIRKYYSGKEAWSEEVITIDESTRQYEEKVCYRQSDKWKKVEVLLPETKLVKTIQRKLKKANYYDGKITGKLDFETQTAILKYQQANSLPQGQLDLETIKRLNIKN